MMFLCHFPLNSVLRDSCKTIIRWLEPTQGIKYGKIQHLPSYFCNNSSSLLKIVRENCENYAFMGKNMKFWRRIAFVTNN